MVARLLILFYAIVSYAVFLASFLYALGFFAIGEQNVDGDDAHVCRRPSSCAPHTVAATRRAPVA